MTFTVEHFHQLTQLLHERPEWRAEMRRLLLTEEILNLPHALSELAVAQQRTEIRVEELAVAQQRTETRVEELAVAQQRTEDGLQRLEARVEELTVALQRLEARVDELAVAQQRTEARVDELAVAQQRTEARVEELAVAQQRTEARVEELAVALQRLEARVEELAVAQQRTEDGLQRLEAQVEVLTVAQQRTEERLNRIEADLHTIKDDLAYLKGRNLEQLHRERPHQYFRGIIAKARTLTIDELRHMTETAVEKAQITENKADDIELADAVVRGTEQQTGARIYLVVESSWGVGKNDVERSARRAAFLADTGIRTRPVAAGRWATPEAHDAAEKLDVWLVVNGHALAPREGESP